MRCLQLFSFNYSLGNPLECSCNVLWLRSWYQESNTHPGPKCRDGNLLTEMRFSKSDCDASNDSRMNQVLMTNEHGDVFKRQINFDECESEHYTDTETIPSSPIESEYFYEQYIDYPLNDTVLEPAAGDNVYDKRLPNDDQSPFSRNTSFIRNDTLLNYEQHQLQLHNNKNSNGGSQFTFFGMPLPSLSGIWNSDQNARKSNSRVDSDGNGKSRLRNFRLRPGEIVDSFQYSNNIQVPTRQPSLLPSIDTEPTNIQPPPIQTNEYPANYYQKPYSTPNIEKGGFIPMLPGRKGFTPIPNPYSNETDATDDIQESVSTELRPNINLEFDEHFDEEPDNKFSILVPTVSPNLSLSQYNVSSLKKDEFSMPTKSSNGISLFRTTPSSTTIATTTIPPKTIASSTTLRTTSTMKILQQSINTNSPNAEFFPDKKYVQKINSKPEIIFATTLKPEYHTPSIHFYPTFLPNSSDVINLSKHRAPQNGSANGKNALSALVAPGAQQNLFRSSGGRSKITKVFNNTTSVLTPTSIPLQSSTVSEIKQTTIITTTQKLPSAEEYLRTTSQNNYIHENTTPISHTKKAQITNDLDEEIIHPKSSDMEWYYNNYNKSTWKEPQLDPGLYRFRSNGVSSLKLGYTKSFTNMILTVILVSMNYFIE